MTSLDNRRRSLWRNPMLWLIAALPVAAIVGGVSMVVITSGQGDDAVADDVRRTAQIQVADIGPDARAQQMKLSAVVRRGKGLIEVIPVNGPFDRAAPLTLALRHPTRGELDRTVELAPTATGWRVDDKLDLTHDWNVQLGPTDRSWRVQGRWPAGQEAAYLRPAVGGTQ